VFGQEIHSGPVLIRQALIGWLHQKKTCEKIFLAKLLPHVMVRIVNRYESICLAHTRPDTMHGTTQKKEKTMTRATKPVHKKSTPKLTGQFLLLVSNAKIVGCSLAV